MNSPISTLSSFLRPDEYRNKIFQYNYIKCQREKNEPKSDNPNQDIEVESMLNNYDANYNSKCVVNSVNSNNNLNRNIPEELIRFKEKTVLFILINMPNDSVDEIIKLESTLKSIENNVKMLRDCLGIFPQHILVFVFLENVNENKNIHYLFPGLSDDQISLEEESKRDIYNCNHLFYDFPSTAGEQNENQNLNIIFVFKKDISLYQAQKVFLTGFCNDLKKNLDDPKNRANAFFTCFLANGIVVEGSSLYKMVRSLILANQPYTKEEDFTLQDNNSFCVTGCLTPISKKFKFYSSVQIYEYFHKEIFDTSYDYSSSRCVIDSRFSMMKITPITLKIISNYFNLNTGEESIEYHSERLSHEIIYKSIGNVSKIYLPDCQAFFDNTESGYSEIMEDYTKRTSAGMRMAFQLIISVFICDCSCKKFGYILINLLRLFSLFVSFALPGLFTFILFNVFFEAFTNANFKAAIFFTVLYTFFHIVIGYLSLIGENPKSVITFFHVIHYIFFTLYFFLFVCIIIAIHHIRIKNQEDLFNPKAFAALFSINFCFSIAPLIINYSKYKKKIVDQLAYILGGASSYSTLFLIYSIFNSVKGSNNHNLKASIIITFLVLYGIFSYLILAIDTKEQRVKALLILSVIFTIYNSIKISINVYNQINYYCFVSKSYSNFYIEELIKPLMMISFPISKLVNNNTVKFKNDKEKLNREVTVNDLKQEVEVENIDKEINLNHISRDGVTHNIDTPDQIEIEVNLDKEYTTEQDLSKPKIENDINALEENQVDIEMDAIEIN